MMSTLRRLVDVAREHAGQRPTEPVVGFSDEHRGEVDVDPNGGSPVQMTTG